MQPSELQIIGPLSAVFVGTPVVSVMAIDTAEPRHILIRAAVGLYERGSMMFAVMTCETFASKWGGI